MMMERNFFLIFCLVGAVNCIPYDYKHVPTPGPLVENMKSDSDPVSVRMTCSQQFTKVLCHFRFTNKAKQDYHILERGTPLEGMHSDFLTITSGKRSVPYDGMLIKRRAPGKDSFVLLAAGDTMYSLVEVTRAYKFPADGLYTIQYTGPLIFLTDEQLDMLEKIKLREHAAVSERIPVQVDVRDVHNLQKLQKEVELEELAQMEAMEPEEDEIEAQLYYNARANACPCCCKPKFIGGTNALRSVTLDLHKNLCGCDGYTKAARVVDSHRGLYRLWLGSRTAGRRNTVVRIFDTCNDKLKNVKVTYQFGSPDCGGSDYAYTYYTGSKVVLCNLYNSAPKSDCTSGSDTKLQTLVHEWTHTFSDTDDYRGAYGSTGSQNLAITNPDQAIDNADNLAYFYCDAQCR